MSGLKPSEQIILDLWDQGYAIDAIALRTGIKRAKVSDVISRYDSPDGHDAMIREGSARLAAALSSFFDKREGARQ